MGKARVLLADDHELFREGLVTLVNGQPDMKVVGQAEDGFEALRLARDLQPDLIIMDINMPMCDGLEATRLIRATDEVASAQILVLTVNEDQESLFEAIKAGANGYLLKGAKAGHFLQGVRQVLGGEAVVTPKLAASLLAEFARLAKAHGSTGPAEDEPDLTFREHEVLRLIAQGNTDKEIAAQFSLSVHTVKSHVRSILGKLHAENRRQAARLARQQGLIVDTGGQRLTPG